MPRYLLKGLLITFLIVAVLVGSGIGVGAAISANLARNVDNANKRGFEEGYSKGYYEGLTLGNEAGYQAGSKLGYIDAGGADINNVGQPGYYFLYNPTYDEIMSTLNSNELHSARQVLDYSRANGIRAAYVRVPIARPATEGRVYLFQLVAFETVDKGMVIIEPGSHRQVIVEEGESYSRLNGFTPSDYDDTITKVTVVW